MRALQFSPDDGFRVAETQSLPLGPDEVRLRVDACGVCGSDRQVVAGESVPQGTAFPLVMGHEIAGTIIETGTGVADWRVGHPVIVHPFIACGDCAPCRHGQSNLCMRQVCVGYQRSGGFSEEVVVPASLLVPRPAACSAAAAALLVDAFATPYRAMKDAGLVVARPGLDGLGGAPGEGRSVGGSPIAYVTGEAVHTDATVLIIGTGGLGLAAQMLCEALGIHHVGVLTRRSLDGAKTASDTEAKNGDASVGSTIASPEIMVSLADGARAVARQIRRWSGAGGIDFVLDTVATADTIAIALEVVRVGGTVAWIGMSEEEARVAVAKTVRRGIRIVASYGSTINDVRELTALVESGGLNPARLLAGTLSLDEATRAFGPDRTSGRWVVCP